MRTRLPLSCGTLASILILAVAVAVGTGRASPPIHGRSVTVADDAQPEPVNVADARETGGLVGRPTTTRSTDILEHRGPALSSKDAASLHQPGNDPSSPPPRISVPNIECVDAEAIAGEGFFYFDNTGPPTVDEPEHGDCTNGTHQQFLNDVWYCWTSPCDSDVTVSTCGGTLVDTRLAVYAGCDCLLLQDRFLGCDDDACIFQSKTTFTAAAGESYLIRIATSPQNGLSGGTGTFTINCGSPQPPCNQATVNCQFRDRWNALTSDRDHYTVADDFVPADNGEITEICWWGAYSDGYGDCHGLTDDTFEVRYYADANGFPGELIGGPFRQSDGSLLLTGPVYTETRVAGDLPEYEYHATHAPVAVHADQCYWIEITNSVSTSCHWLWQVAQEENGRAVRDGTTDTSPDGYDVEEIIAGDLAFCLNLPLVRALHCPPAPANDDCSDALPIYDGETVVDTTRATTDGPGESESCSPPDTCCDFPLGDNQIHYDIWYGYVATCSGTLIVDLTESDFDTKIAVYEGADCPTESGAAACNDDASGAGLALQSQVSLPVQQGAHYEIRVGGYGVFATDESPCDRYSERPGCPNRACEAMVCSAIPSCCESSWATNCVAEAVNVCPGSCYSTDSATPGCANLQCQARVCSVLPSCCDGDWSSNCVDKAIELCAGTAGTGTIRLMCGDPSPGDLCQNAPIESLPFTFTGTNHHASHDCPLFPGSHTWIAFDVCDPSSVTLDYCGAAPVFERAWLNLAQGCPCSHVTGSARREPCPDGNVRLTWDCLQPGTYYYPILSEPGSVGDYSITVTTEPCVHTCVIDAGDCCAANGTVGCEDATCCETVCGVDPFCCEFAWDDLCARRASQLCGACPGGTCDSGFGGCLTPHDSPGCMDAEICEAVCTCDPYCCDGQWDEYCAGEGLSSNCGAALDCNQNAFPDVVDIARGDSQDCNGNLIPDECEPDCNENLIADECDIQGCYSDDCNDNVVPDECEIGDVNGDGSIDLGDVAGLVDCLTSPCEPSCDPALYADPCCFIVDFDNDGDVDIEDAGEFQRLFMTEP